MLITFLKSNNLFLSTVVILLINLSSCQSPHFYRPRPLEPVLLSHEKQLTVNIIADEMGAYSIAYSPVSHLGIQAGAGHKSGQDDASDETYFNPYISAGYYKMVTQGSLLEVYGGAGVYVYKKKLESPIQKINFSNYFLQPSFAFLHKNIDVAFTIRGDYFKRNNTTVSTNQPPDTSTFQYSFLKHTNYFFIQPGITMRAGIKNVKAQLQLSKSYPFSKNYNSIYGLEYNTSTPTDYIVDNKIKLAIGIMVDFEDIIGKHRSVENK